MTLLAGHRLPPLTASPPPLPSAPLPSCSLRSVELVCRRFHELSRNAPQLHLTAVVMKQHLRTALVRVRSLAGGQARFQCSQCAAVSPRRALLPAQASRSALPCRVARAARRQCAAPAHESQPAPRQRGRDAEGDGLPPNTDATESGDQLEQLTETLQAVAFCAGRGGLQELNLRFDFLPAFRFSAATTAALAGLRSLRLSVSGGGPDGADGLLAVVGPLHIMTALRELRLRGEPLHLRLGLRLPPGLTLLQLESEIERTLEGLPEQVGCQVVSPAWLAPHALCTSGGGQAAAVLPPAQRYSLLPPAPLRPAVILDRLA